MLKTVKALHLIGLAMFFGSILGHITVGLIPGAGDDPGTALIGRQAIDAATTYLTIPGLALLVLTGIFMIVKGRLPILKMRWLMLHVILGLLIVLNAAFVLLPTGEVLLDIAAQVAAGQLPMDRLHALGGREAAFGAANVAMCLAALFLAVFKPPMGNTKP